MTPTISIDFDYSHSMNRKTVTKISTAHDSDYSHSMNKKTVTKKYMTPIIRTAKQL